MRAPLRAVRVLTQRAGHAAAASPFRPAAPLPPAASQSEADVAALAAMGYPEQVAPGSGRIV
jgi:hypothetical protein